MKKLGLKSLNQFIKFPNKSKLSIICLISSIVFTIPELSMAQARFGVNAGANFSKVILSNSNSDFQEYDFIPGFQIGLSVEIPFADHIFLQPSVSYIRKGFKSPNAGYLGYQTDFRLKADYLELPILVLFKPNLGNGKFLFGAGPYIAYGTGGSWNSDIGVGVGDINIGNKGDVIFRNDGSEGGALDSYTYGRPFDYGLSGLLGYEISQQISFQLEGKFGIANLQPRYGEFTPQQKIRNISIGLSGGYKF